MSRKKLTKTERARRKRKKAVRERKDGLAPTAIPEALAKMYPPEWLEETSKETGLIKRQRKIEAVGFFWVLVLSFGLGMQRSLAGLKRQYEKRINKSLSDGSWYPRFTPELVLFLKTCVMHGIAQLGQHANRNLNERLAHFEDVLIQDSTIIRLHQKLSKIWPATRTKTVAAGVKVSLLISAVANGPKTVALYGERTSEIKTLRIGPWVRDRILLLDLGFYKQQMFARVAENGGFFVTRLKKGANPLFVASNKTHRGRSIDIAGKRWKDLSSKLKREVLDAQVEIQFTRRKYRGKRSRDAMEVRLVAIRHPESGEYHAYLTNITPDVLDAQEVARLYGARWEVELVFKELKSRSALDQIQSTDPQVIEALIWVSLLTLLVSRRVHHVIRAVVPPDKLVRYTQARWSHIFAENARDLLHILLDYFEYPSGFIERMELFNSIYESQALDPHIDRHRFRDEWWV